VSARRWLAPVILAVAALAAFGCTEIGSNPSAAVSMSFDTLPYPSVVVGDSMRDTSGAVANFRGHAFNGQNAEIPNAPIKYFSLDPNALSVDSTTGKAFADSLRSSAVTVMASINGLQIRKTIDLVASPDSLFTNGDTSLTYVLPDTGTIAADLNTSVPLQVKVLHNDSAGFTSPVRSVVVRYTITYPAASATTGTPSDTTHAAFLLSDLTRARSSVDTTDISGLAARRVRVRPGLLAGATDSVVVMATARYRGVDITGSPARLVLRVVPVP
jgi:hypothetical protein